MLTNFNNDLQIDKNFRLNKQKIYPFLLKDNSDPILKSQNFMSIHSHTFFKVYYFEE